MNSLNLVIGEMSLQIVDHLAALWHGMMHEWILTKFDETIDERERERQREKEKNYPRDQHCHQ